MTMTNDDAAFLVCGLAWGVMGLFFVLAVPFVAPLGWFYIVLSAFNVGMLVGSLESRPQQ